MLPEQAEAPGLGAGGHIGLGQQQQQQQRSPTRHQPPVEIVRTPVGQYERLQFDPADGLLVDLPRDSAEYADVEELCGRYRGGHFSSRIVSIERVCNPGAYDKFWAEVEQYRRHKPHAHVCRLLHGTTAANKDSVAENNLLKERIAIGDYQRSRPYYCGDGFYFTQSFPYAASHTTKHGVPPTPLRHVFVFDVLVGDVDKPPHYTNKDKIPGLMWEWKKIFESKGLNLDELRPSKTKLPLYMRYDTAQPREEGIDSVAKFEESEFYPTHLITYTYSEEPNLNLE